MRAGRTTSAAIDQSGHAQPAHRRQSGLLVSLEVWPPVAVRIAQSPAFTPLDVAPFAADAGACSRIEQVYRDHGVQAEAALADAGLYDAV